MANRTYLSACNTLPKYQNLEGSGVACAASYMIPIFWYMLFKPENITKSSTPCDEDEPDFEYDRLIAKRLEAIEVAKGRLPILAQILSYDPTPLFNTWIEFITNSDGGYVFVESCELAMMDDVSVFSKQALNCIEAFSESPTTKKGLIFKKDQVNPKWAELFGQAEISDMANIEEYKLAGYSWEKEVPWE
jgi:hypothetical protein